MSYTEFGKYFRILRIKNNEVLADAKKFLGVSTAFISSVECGKKNIPDDWAAKIMHHYHLNNNEYTQLIESIEKSQKSIRIDFSEASSLQKQVALQFQRSFEENDEKTMLEIKKILERNKKK